ncbi:MAG: arginine--tRNA ligase [Planctomycetota bacterium]|nr:MAG: arginine--tRNA ligase [Planctomycetota bacterium]
MNASSPVGPHGLDRFAARIRAALADALGVEAGTIQLERPRQEQLGDFALPCFRFAKERGGNPAALAARLAGELAVAEVEPAAAGPFLNFRVDRPALAAAVLADAERPDFGGGGDGGTTLVEYSSPNIAKPMHVGHLRSTVIGAALARIFAHLGHRVVRINHLGDWGSQFGKLVAAWRRWGSEPAIEADPIGHLLELYVRYHREEEADPGLADEAKAAFRELESGEDNDTRRIWRRFTTLSLREFDKVYRRLGSDFDFVRGESWYEDQLGPLLDWLAERGVLEESDGATIIDLSAQGIKTPMLVRTAHGTTLYATRDLAAALSRWREFAFDRCLYVVGQEQKLHFAQLVAALERAGCDWARRIEHVPFGLIRMAEGRLSTRAGRVLALRELLDRAVELAAEVIAEKNPDLPDRAAAAEQIGVGAVIFHDLKHQRTKDVVFDWDKVLSFEGDTGPYLQYTHARCCAILRKAGRPAPATSEIDPGLLADSPELLVALGRFPQAVREAADRREPMMLAQHLLKLGAAINAFYRDRRVLGEEPALEDARLAAVDRARRVLALGLGLLGVPAPEEM